MREMNLLGERLSDDDAHFVRVYEELKVLAARNDLPPCAERNVKKALACMWQVMNDLNLEYEQLYDLGV